MARATIRRGTGSVATDIVVRRLLKELRAMGHDVDEEELRKMMDPHLTYRENRRRILEFLEAQRDDQPVAAFRPLHFPHARGAEEARERGHTDPFFIRACDIIAEANREILSAYTGNYTPPEVLEAEDDYEGWEAFERRIAREIADRLRRLGVDAEVVDLGDYEGVLFRHGRTWFLAAPSSHDETGVWHLYALVSAGDLPRPAALRLARAFFEAIYEHPEVEEGTAELLLTRGGRLTARRIYASE